MLFNLELAKKHFFKWLKGIIFLTLVSSVFYATKEIWGDFGYYMGKVDVSSFLLISFLFILNQTINGYMIKQYISVFEVKLDFVEWFGLVWVQSFGNLLPMSAGLLSNAAYLKVKRQVGTSKFISYVIGDTVVKFLVLGSISIVIIVYEFLIGGEFQKTVLVFTFLILFVGLLAVFFPSLKSNNKIFNWFVKIQLGWLDIKKNKQVLAFSFLSQIAALFLIGLQTYIVFNLLGVNLPFSLVLLITIFTSIIRIASIFPGNLGLRESISGYFTLAFNLTFSIGVLASMIQRVVTMFWIFLFGITFSIYFFKKSKLIN
tara:strand:- start:748 stop:1695 length:948 start_codon:yes stop_codon:yes gene_type:complete